MLSALSTIARRETGGRIATQYVFTKKQTATNKPSKNLPSLTVNTMQQNKETSRHHEQHRTIKTHKTTRQNINTHHTTIHYLS